MATWLSDAASSHRLHLGFTAVVSGCIAAAAVIGLQEARRRYDLVDLKRSIPDLDTPHDIVRLNDVGSTEPDVVGDADDQRSAALARRARLGDYDEDLIMEQLARNRVFLSDDGLAKLRKAFVIVVGCGGVGSHATAALARSGCGRLRLIDFDQVTLSSLNRHAVATLADVGTPKVVCLRKRLEQIVPWTHFDCRNELFGEDSAAGQLCSWHDGQEPTFVIDAIDNIDSKVALLHYCHSRHIPVISSMGAGCKSDPTRVFVGDISSSTDDPLSRSTRRKLRLLGVADGIPVVYSSEKAGPGKAQLLPLPDDEFRKGAVGELGVLPSFRARILPVLGTMPAVFGLCAANHVLLAIAGYPSPAYLPSKARDKMYDGILAQLQASEQKLARAQGLDPLGLRLPVSVHDVGYLVEEVFRGRSVVSGLASRLALVRWRRPPSPSSSPPHQQPWLDAASVPGQNADRLRFDDLVCVTRDELVRHEDLVFRQRLPPEEVYPPDVVQLVEARMQEERVFHSQR